MDEKVIVLTADELAIRWKMHYNTIISKIRSGEIEGAYKFGKLYRIPMDVVEEYEKEHKFRV